MPTVTATLLTCKCGTDFEWNGYGIKPKRCPQCQFAINREKQMQYSKKVQQNRIARNKELLAQSTFNTSKGKTSSKKGGKKTRTPRQKARDTADRWFSRYIRIKHHYKIANGEVFCQCFIQPSIIKHAKNMDNGHCFSRAFLLTRYHIDNCRPQNRSSNRFSGEADHYKFRDKLQAEIGTERFETINTLRKQEGNDTEQFYTEQADKYKKLTNQLVQQYEINKWW